jgi:Stress responsive A/B Barrel Domain
MNRTLLQLLLAVISPTAMLLTGLASVKKEPVRHVVVFKYKQGATDDQIRQVTDAFRALKNKIPGIVSFEHGINNSPEGKNLGFTHVYQLTFEDAKARDAYLPHPEHKKFGELLGRLSVLEDVFVVDYVPEN